MNKDAEKQIYCTDLSICAGIARRNVRGKWELWGLSEVLGMGNAEYNVRLSPEEYDEVYTTNTCTGIAIVEIIKDKLPKRLQLKFVGNEHEAITSKSWEWDMVGRRYGFYVRKYWQSG
jgi:hypothetical protein